MTAPFDMAAQMQSMGRAAREASAALRDASGVQRAETVRHMANAIGEQGVEILAANRQDVEAGRAKGLSDALIDRLTLDEARIDGMIASLRAIADQKDPVGEVLECWEQPNGLKFSKVSVPIGVIGMIYESRPNVTADAGALCIKSGNAVILRSGSEALRSSLAIHTALTQGLMLGGLPKACIQLVNVPDRAAVGEMLSGLSGAIDLLIPRGGRSLVERVQTEARVPVLAHLDGLCHTYVHAEADPAMAEAIVLNAKLRRTGVCGATETVLCDTSDMAERLAARLLEQGCEVRARGFAADGVIAATDTDFETEHLAPIVNMAVVDGFDSALAHIARFGSGHTDAIITQNQKVADHFLTRVDSAIVLHNASTQFADGGEFGFGAEIGISTGRLHARGPVGARHLVSYKYQLRGSGQTRP